MKAANPYLNFKGNTLDAFTFYKSIFGGDLSVLRYKDFGDNSMGVAADELDKVAHVALPLGPHNTLMGTDAVGSQGKALTVGNNFSITLEPESAEEAERVFEALSASGRVDMPLGKTEWAEKYGMCTDKFGVQWMVNYTGNVHFGE
jgi:PhnB protein